MDADEFILKIVHAQMTMPTMNYFIQKLSTNYIPMFFTIYIKFFHKVKIIIKIFKFVY